MQEKQIYLKEKSRKKTKRKRETQECRFLIVNYLSQLTSQCAGRFDRCIYVGPPDKEARCGILRLQLSKMKRLGSDIRLEEIVDRTENYTGADLANICRKAALGALMNNREVRDGFVCTKTKKIIYIPF